MTLNEFLKMTGTVLDVQENYVCIKNLEVKFGNFLCGVAGRGKTTLHAINDLCKDISNQTVVVEAGTDNRREYKTPEIVYEYHKETVMKEFDKSRVYTALNADELCAGASVVVSDDLSSLKEKVNNNGSIVELEGVLDDSKCRRFLALGISFTLAYLVERAEAPDPYAELKKTQKKGETIQLRCKDKWIDLDNGDEISWNNPPENYRAKPKPKYVPWTEGTCPLECGSEVERADGAALLVGGVNKQYKMKAIYCEGLWWSYAELFNYGYTFHGKPCGQEVEG